ncbi:ribose 1,5-bisphosphokinase [Rahnella victoriana]|uniref:ribose 1,5-bisphosphokinase n=1 Tax=Rahnella victoriana TaxID=1510570 RepID=UPI001E32307A|nr:ribose 1,5-bisphosphokinase [Rahnella victoriana]UHM92687.1 ribose 1,5-bisphosphokinase [Rahnella victoriana]
MSRLLYLMGASGSGKDSLLDALRQHLPANVAVAHRYITRPADAGSENHIALSEAEFIQRHRQGLFALDWYAHQCRYGVGIEIDHWMQLGCHVVINGSRAHLEKARQRYGQRLVPVCLLVSETVLVERLTRRGREDAAQVAGRLQRAREYASALPAGCHLLNNDGALQETLQHLLAILSLPVNAYIYPVTSS